VSSIIYAYEDDDDLVRLEHRFASGVDAHFRVVVG
jgi:hypothetical protein